MLTKHLLFVARYASTVATVSSDAVCTALTSCPLGQYAAVPSTPTSDRAQCTPVTQSCPPGTSESAPPTITSDRVCGPCPQGTFRGAFDAACTSWGTCNASEYQTSAPTSSTNRVCSALRVCSARQYVASSSLLHGYWGVPCENRVEYRRCVPCAWEEYFLTCFVLYKVCLDAQLAVGYWLQCCADGALR